MSRLIQNKILQSVSSVGSLASDEKTQEIGDHVEREAREIHLLQLLLVPPDEGLGLPSDWLSKA